MHITIASAQYPITRHKSLAGWQQHTEAWVRRAVARKARLLLFPEYGSMELVSIFPEAIRVDIQRQIVEIDALKDDFCEVFSHLAKKYQVDIVAPSIPVIQNGRTVNRCYIFSPRSCAGYQDKFFMTRFENETWGVSGGPRLLTVFESDWGNFGIQICYDVEFPLGAHQLSAAGATVILAPSCTETIRGAARVHIGARARALENQLYTVVSQTVGEALWSPAVDINYGYAAFYSTPDNDLPEEGIISHMLPQSTGWLVHTLDLKKLDAVRSNGQVFNYKDQQKLDYRLPDEAIQIQKQLL